MASAMPVGEARLHWNDLLSTVQTQYPANFRAWFDTLAPGEMHAGELRVRVDDPAQARFLRENCAAAFNAAAMTLTGHLVATRFICDAEREAAVVVNHDLAALQRSPLSPDYTFEQFVVGPSNRLAHAACRAVCDQPGSLYNPLFIHGCSGLGKSHLLQATCGELQRRLGQEVIYATCDSFINDLVRALQSGRLQQFRDKSRNASALVIDDVQFLANRESSQEELFHTFNALYQARRQIILSADQAPSAIPTLEDRLVSRFNWGLVTQIDPPNRETRHAILKNKALLRGCEVPDDVLDLIAERVEANIRVLEGALTKLISETRLEGKPMNMETARQVLESFQGGPARLVQINDILEVISSHFGVRMSDLVGKKRSRSVSHPRQVGMFLARRLTPLSLQEIGHHFGNRDHSTVLHAERVIEDQSKRDRNKAETLSRLTQKLLSKR